MAGLDTQSDVREIVPGGGARGVALDKLIALVAGSSHFQHAIGMDEAAARSRIFAPHLDDPKQKVPTHVVIGVGGLGYRRMDDGTYHPAGSMYLRFAVRASEAENRAKSLIAFVDAADGLLADILELAATDDRLCISDVEPLGEPAATPPQNVAGQLAARFYWHEAWKITWDTLGG
ncbi:MAG: hypothetical protein GY838_03940 [bacterium]|nr:hypothetical protein [bacterium]